MLRRYSEQPAKENGMTERGHCEWKAVEDGPWETTCGHAFEINEGVPSDNGMQFCCYCGKPLFEIPYVEEE